VKSLAADGILKKRALAAIAAGPADPAAISADVTLGRSGLLSFATFRRKVNPVLYQPGDDQHACADCHANHTILQVAEADRSRGFSDQQLLINYKSTLKVVNLGEPEASLILRKPMSPQGQGNALASSPTGLTHVGGPRWENTEHPAYRAILEWILESSTAASAGSGSEILSADSYSPGYEPAQAGDGDITTIWHTEFVGATPGYPHELVVDLGTPRMMDGLLYVPRQDVSNGRVRDFQVRISNDGRSWSEPLASGSWSNDTSIKYVTLPGRRARFVQLRGLSEVEGRPIMSAAELSVDTAAFADRQGSAAGPPAPPAAAPVRPASNR
jgi:hypothetical protein